MIIAVDGPAAAGKGTHRRAHRPPLRFAFPRYGTSLSHGRESRARSRRDLRAMQRRRSRRRGRLNPSRYRESDLRLEAIGDAASTVAVNRRCALGAARLPARFRPQEAGRGARRPRYRHGRMPRRHRQDFRDRLAGSSGPAAHPRAFAERRTPSTLKRCWPRSAPATSATAGGRPRRSFPLPTRMSRHVRYEYRRSGAAGDRTWSKPQKAVASRAASRPAAMRVSRVQFLKSTTLIWCP